MKARRLPQLGLGSAPLGGLFAPVEHDDGVAAVRAAVEAGYRYVDTAPLYGYGSAEAIVGDALRGSTDVLLSTKVGLILLPDADRAPDDIFKGSTKGAAYFDFSRDAVRRSVFESLVRLRRHHLDLVLIHDPDDHSDQAISEAYPALEELRTEGVLTSIGVGMNRSDIPTRFVKETDIDMVIVAGRYTLLDRSAEDDLLPVALDRGVGVVAAGVYNSGVLAPTDLPATYDYRSPSRVIVDRVKKLRRVCAAYGVPLAAAAAQFPLRHPAVTTVLLGARKAGEAIQNLGFMQMAIPDGLWEAIEDLHAADNARKSP